MQTLPLFNNPSQGYTPVSGRELSIAMCLSCSLLLAACGGGGGGGSAAPPVAAAPQFPAPPAISARQIDRMGRAAITSALISPLAAPAQRGANRDAYNQAPRSTWPSFAASIGATLAVFDALDAQCGNQVLADPAAAGSARYATLAGALADDRLYINGASGLCTQYLGVELNATGVAANNDCGGRPPSYDVIDVSYTALSNDLSLAVGDGVASDTVLQDDRNFPFLASFVPAPAPPAILARQIDRMGRAAITSALISPLAAPAQRGADRDAYNFAARADWPMFTNNIRASLGVYDALDTVCGNQILANPAAADASRYDTLAGALTDDRLYVRGSSGVCTQYLGVELNATGLVANTDCGGRTPLYDTIDVNYTALSNNLALVVGDGVPSDNVVHSAVVFPFLAQP